MLKKTQAVANGKIPTSNQRLGLETDLGTKVKVKFDPTFRLDKINSSDQYLLTRRMILNGEIEEGSIRQAMEEISLLLYIDPIKDITLLINSEGGEVYEALAFIDFITSLPCDISTIVTGKAMSAAFSIAISGTKGKRYITPNATLMEHQISAAAIGKLSELEVEALECKRLEKLIEQLIKDRTKCPASMIRKFRIKNCYFTPEEAVKYGIVDKIITRIL